jgi:hypothetical protein
MGKSYLVRDPNVLAGMKAIYAPVFDVGMDFSATRELPSGAARIVALPRTVRLQPAGAMNVFPATVVFGVSADITSPEGWAAVCRAKRQMARTRVSAFMGRT